MNTLDTYSTLRILSYLRKIDIQAFAVTCKIHNNLSQKPLKNITDKIRQLFRKHIIHYLKISAINCKAFWLQRYAGEPPKLRFAYIKIKDSPRCFAYCLIYHLNYNNPRNKYFRVYIPFRVQYKWVLYDFEYCNNYLDKKYIYIIQ